MSPVEDLLPHRPPWLLVDRVVSAGDGRVRAEKKLSAGDPLLHAGEFPEALVVEALAQTIACLRGADASPQIGYLAAVSGFEFHGRARAGDTLTLDAVETAHLGALRRFGGEASVDGRVVARGELTFALERQ